MQVGKKGQHKIMQVSIQELVKNTMVGHINSL